MTVINKNIVVTAAVLCGTTVIIGAFGAHYLSPLLLQTGKTSVFETGVKYQMFHSLGLLGIGILQQHISIPRLKVIYWLFLLGILLFCGSLYALAVFGTGSFGWVTPIGGLLLIAGWIALALSIKKPTDR